MHESNIYTIHSAHNSAPPSYAEAMQQSRHTSSDHITSYNQEYSQISSYPHPQLNQPPYDVQDMRYTIHRTEYLYGVPNHEIQTTSTTAFTNGITDPRREKLVTSCRIIWAASVFVITLVVFIMIIKQFIKN